MKTSRYNCLPREMLTNGISLNSIGIDETAWKFKQAIEVIEYLYNKGYLILGGDVYVFDGFSIKPTYDNWYHNKTESDNDLELGRKKAIEYITKHQVNYGDNYIYSIVYDID